MKRTFLTTANTEAKVRKIADWYGWQAEEDNDGQIIIYTDIPEGAPQVAQEAADRDWETFFSYYLLWLCGYDVIIA